MRWLLLLVLIGLSGCKSNSPPNYSQQWQINGENVTVTGYVLDSETLTWWGPDGIKHNVTLEAPK